MTRTLANALQLKIDISQTNNKTYAIIGGDVPKYKYRMKGGPITTEDKDLVELLQGLATLHFNQTAITKFLINCGYTSKTGKQLTNSHISNFLRKDLEYHYVAKYPKPNYKGRNWETCKKEKAKKPPKILPQIAAMCYYRKKIATPDQ